MDGAGYKFYINTSGRLYFMLKNAGSTDGWE